MPTRFPLRVAVAVLLLGGPAVGVAGCAGTTTDEVDPATAACRHTWSTLENEIADRGSVKTPSQLTDRWAAVRAGVSYHVVSGTASDCGRPLHAQRKAIATLDSFQRKIQDYDMELALRQMTGVVRIYVKSPPPTRAELGDAGAPIPHARARHALQSLEKYAARANSDLADAWSEIAGTDIGDKAEVHRVLSDLAFLAGRSEAFSQCAEAMKVLRQVVRQQFATLSGASSSSPSPSVTGSSSPSPTASSS